MTLDHETELEQKIYEAAFVPDLWPDVLDRLSRIAGALGGVLFGVVDAHSRWTSSGAVAEAMSAFINEGWHARNIRAQAGFTRKLDQEPRFVTEADMFDDDGYLADPIYKQFWIPNGGGWHAGTVVNGLHGDSLIISVEKPFADGPVSDSALAALDRMRPHLARAGLVSARLAFERVRTSVEMMSSIGLPAFGLSAKGGITVTNALFDGLPKIWTTRAGDILAFSNDRAQRLVAQALAGIRGPHGVRSIPLTGSVDEEPAVLHLIPVRRSAHDLFSGSAAIGVISKRSRTAPEAIPVLQALFDLSPAEARVAVRIAAARTAEQIAAEDNRSVETIRGHIKNVQAKTGCRRQADLASLLPQLLQPYQRPD